jgi:hypothetical protein
MSLPLSTGLEPARKKPESGKRKGSALTAMPPSRDAADRGGGTLMLDYEDDGLIMSQIRTAEFARMSTSKQLSLWAILRAQLSSKKQLEAQTPRPAQKTVPASPTE